MHQNVEMTFGQAQPVLTFGWKISGALAPGRNVSSRCHQKNEFPSTHLMSLTNGPWREYLPGSRANIRMPCLPCWGAISLLRYPSLTNTESVNAETVRLINQLVR